MTVNLQELLATTFEVMDDQLYQSFEQAAWFYSKIRKMPSKRTNQKGRVYPIMTSPNPAINYRPEGGAFASGNTHKAKQFRIFFARPAITRRLTGDAIDLDDEDSIINAATDGLDMDNATLFKDMNQEMFSDATGTKAVVASVSGAVVTFALPLGATRILERGQYQFFDPATNVAVVSTVYTVKEGGVNKGSRTAEMTVSVSGSVVAGHVLAWNESYLQTLTGLEHLISDSSTDLQGVSRALVPSIKSPNVNAASKALSLSLIDQQELQVGIRSGNIELKDMKIEIVTSFTQVQAYRDLGRNYQNYTSGTKFDGGNGGIGNQTANGRPIKVDVDCKTSDWWFLNWSAFVLCEYTKYGLISPDGLRLRMVPGYSSTGVGSYLDQSVYMVGGKFDVGVVLPQTCSRMYDLDTTGLVNPHSN